VLWCQIQASIDASDCRNRAEAALSDGRADVVSFATPYIANPDLVERFRFGASLAEPD
jgi:N-ethylmaleimide reductase